MSHSVLPCAWTGAWSADCSDNFILLARDNYSCCVQKHNRGLNPKGISSLGDRQRLQLNCDGGYTPFVIGTDFAAGTTRPPQLLHLMIEVSSSELIVCRQDHAIRPHESSALWFVKWVAIEGVNPAPQIRAPGWRRSQTPETRIPAYRREKLIGRCAHIRSVGDIHGGAIGSKFWIPHTIVRR